MTVKERFPWYDAGWLRQYVKAREFVALHHPERLDAFTRAFQPLKTPPDFREKRISDPFTPAQVQLIRTAARSLNMNQLELGEVVTHGRLVVYDHPLLEGLHAEIAPRVSELVGEEVEPAYTFLALYKKHGRCALHLDSPEAKWTVDFCIEQSDPWPIHFSEPVDWPERGCERSGDWQERIRSSAGHAFSSHALLPGEAIVFSGSGQWHYRDPFPGAGAAAHWTLLFLHFIPAGTRDLLAPGNWERRFGLPALSSVIDARWTGLEHRDRIRVVGQS